MKASGLLRFTADELTEMIRALVLIGTEDADANVNMDAASVRAKRSALRKLQQLIASTRLHSRSVPVSRRTR